MDIKKVVLITTGYNGFGAAVACQLAILQAKLAVVGRKEEVLKRLALHCEQTTGLKPLIIVADINKTPDVIRVIQETVEHYGKLEVLVNCAMTAPSGGIKNTSIQTFDFIMKNNIRSVYNLTQFAVPYLIQSKGCIVNVIGPCSTWPQSIAVAYNMSKVALNNFSRSIALELTDDGVSVNSVNATYVKPSEACTDEYQITFLATTINNKPQQDVSSTGQEIAEMIGFLASDEGKAITGATFVLSTNN